MVVGVKCIQFSERTYSGVPIPRRLGNPRFRERRHEPTESGPDPSGRSGTRRERGHREIFGTINRRR